MYSLFSNIVFVALLSIKICLFFKSGRSAPLLFAFFHICHIIRIYVWVPLCYGLMTYSCFWSILLFSFYPGPIQVSRLQNLGLLYFSVCLVGPCFLSIFCDAFFNKSCPFSIQFICVWSPFFWVCRFRLCCVSPWRLFVTVLFLFSWADGA